MRRHWRNPSSPWFATIAALSALAQLDCPEREEALEEFYARW